MKKTLVEKKKYSFNDFRKIIEILRSKEGCPWDREQTHDSLRENLLEESYEVIDAINNNDVENLSEELGDLFLQVMMHSQIASEENHFTIEEVIHKISEKMIRRHPHIFGEDQLETTEEVMDRWDHIKKIEKKSDTTTEEIRNIPKALPALVRAYKVQKKAKKVGFDFDNIEDVMGKVDEELSEFKEAVSMGKKKEIDEEFGDLLFSMVNLSRFFRLNAEFSLTNAIEKFINRFEGVENLALKEGKTLSTMNLEEMNALWKKVK
ncbi:tetrapyrrole methylase family protein/MazG family protein [Natranaerovirga pectinivora]|uniref:Tetrapyrrole methylase family protein/MazG family protein n=1 Tax=Natranaerovirga pectinivora TaxID=682400 RepID=A0A4R3MIA8_9FIRM|nr:nucleoside triphosphate pyrophosphohydrolase [Natranaerovirga pectinivora]TCT13054.1 tetrapyrrole methylase family protein/MazG family protein [Natranaerovirga pectinivora]